MKEYLNIEIFFAKGYISNWSGEVFVINGGEIFEMFFKKELQKTNQEEFKLLKKVINYMLDG